MCRQQLLTSHYVRWLEYSCCSRNWGTLVYIWGLWLVTFCLRMTNKWHALTYWLGDFRSTSPKGQSLSKWSKCHFKCSQSSDLSNRLAAIPCFQESLIWTENLQFCHWNYPYVRNKIFIFCFVWILMIVKNLGIEKGVYSFTEIKHCK